MKTGQLGEARSWPRPKRPICRATAPTPPDRPAKIPLPQSTALHRNHLTCTRSVTDSGGREVEWAADVAAVNAVTHGTAAGTSTCRGPAQDERMGGERADDSKSRRGKKTGLRKGAWPWP